MTKDKRKLVQALKKVHREKLSKLRQKQDQELYAYCEGHGGHFWWSWIEDPAYSIGGTLFHTHYRACSGCDKREYKIEKDKAYLTQDFGKCHKESCRAVSNQVNHSYCDTCKSILDGSYYL